MNILFFLTPKEDVAYLESHYSIRQTIEKIFARGYSAVPVLDQEGHYIRTVSEGDLFRYIIKNMKEDIHDFHDNILSLDEGRKYVSIHNDSSMEELYNIINDQNFVPVLDDRDFFIGIITRKKVIEYLKNK